MSSTKGDKNLRISLHEMNSVQTLYHTLKLMSKSGREQGGRLYTLNQPRGVAVTMHMRTTIPLEQMSCDHGQLLRFCETSSTSYNQDLINEAMLFCKPL